VTNDRNRILVIIAVAYCLSRARKQLLRGSTPLWSGVASGPACHPASWTARSQWLHRRAALVTHRDESRCLLQQLRDPVGGEPRWPACS